MAWNPDLYNRFKKERFAPFDDLLALLHPEPQLQVTDLGCGTGELTRRLADALPGATVLGIDSSPEMLQQAASFQNERLHFRLQSIESTLQTPHTCDLLFSNAALQWVHDHEQLWPRLAAMIRPGGQLAVQMPSNHRHFSHVLIREMAATEPFRSALGGFVRLSPVLEPDVYAQLLFDQGARELTVFEKVYPHVLDDASALLDWISGTALLPYLERLPADLRETFKTRCLERLQERFPQAPVFYPFRRILMHARF